MFFPNVINRSVFNRKPPRGSIINENHPLARGLYACYPLNEMAGDTIHDLRNVQDGLFDPNGKTQWHPEGVIFDGAGDLAYISLGNMSLVADSQFNNGCCIIAYYYPTSEGNGDWRIISKSTSSASADAHTWMLSRQVGAIHRTRFKFGAITMTTEGVIPVPIDRWYHFAATVRYDPSSNISDVYIYTNNQFDATEKGNGSLAIEPTVPTEIGRNPDAYGSLRGILSYVYIYNRYLSPEEIKEIYDYPYCFIKENINKTYIIPTSVSAPTAFISGPFTILRPTGDLITGTWQTSPLFDKIDEATPSSTDFVQSAYFPQYDTFVVGLEAGTRIDYNNEGYRINYQYGKIDSNNSGVVTDLIIDLISDETLIHSEVIPNIQSGYTSGYFMLNPNEGEKISGNYDRLKLSFTAYSDTLNSGLFAYWKLNETGSIRYNAIGTGHLKPIGSPSFITGKDDYALLLSGDQYVYTTGNYQLNLFTNDQPFTLSAWVYSTGWGADQPNALPGIMVKGTGANSFHEYALYYDKNADVIRFQVGDGGISSGTLSLVTSPINNKWYHLVSMHDNINNQLRGWANGAEVTPTSWSNGTLSSTGNLSIGTLPYNTGSAFRGIIDEVGFYQRMLTSGEIQRLYNNGYSKNYPFGISPLANGLVHYYPLNETGGVKRDLVGQQNLLHMDETIEYSGTLFNDTGFYNTSGNLAFLRIPPTHWPFFNGLSSGYGASLTFSFWTKRFNINVNNDFIYYYYTYQFGNGGWNTRITKIEGTYRQGVDYVPIAENSESLNNANNPVPNDQTWVLHIVRISGANNYQGGNSGHLSQMAVFHSGVINGGFGLFSENTGYRIPTSTVSFMVGGREHANNDRLYDMAMCDVGVWNRYLTDDELRRLYNKGVGRRPYTNLNSLHENLITYFPMGELSGSRYSVTDGTYLVDTNTVARGRGKIKTGVFFVEVNDEVLSAPDSNNLSLGPDVSFSWSFWINKSGAVGQDKNILLKGTSWVNNQNKEYNFYHPANSNGVAFVVGNGSTSTNVTGAMQFNRWNHIVGVHDHNADKLYLYINGQKTGEADWAGGTQDTNGSLEMGGTALSATAYTDGYIDEVGFWKKALSPNEVKFLYNNRAGRSYPFI